VSDTPQRRLPVQPPTVPAPPRFRERRARSRREADGAAAEEIAFLAGLLDEVAGLGTAEERLAGVLERIARTARAERTAILSDRGERRIATSIHPDEDPAAAEALATWLDSGAPRSRAERAASAPALISLAIVGGGMASTPPAASDPSTAPADGPGPVPSANEGRYACVTIPSDATVVLGFDFGDAAMTVAWERRFPAAYARHAGAAIALVSDELAIERELEQLRTRDMERTRFVSTVAHELRTPLTALGGYLELILAGDVQDPEIHQEFLTRSGEIVGSMDELVGDLLELARLESGSLQLEIDAFSVAETGQRVLDHLAPIAAQRSITLQATLPPRLRAARGDRRRVEQILKNLIGNALKFTPTGGSVELAAWFDGPLAVVAVRDDGMGIADDDRVRIFERFYRMSSHERVNGTGLGLPIAREMARAMDGDLDVASVQKSGSSFVLVLPGQVPVERPTMAGILDHILDAEHQRLYDQGVLRRLQMLGRDALPGAGARVDQPAEQPVPRLTAGGPSRPGGLLRRTGEERAAHLRLVEPEPPGG